MLLATLATLVTPSARAGCAEGVPTDLSVVTFNAWGLPAPIARDRAGRLPRIARWLDDQGFDVAGLQEVWWGARGFLPLGLSLPTGRADSGLALRTSLAVDGVRLHTFDAERGFDAWKSKGVLLADVAVGEQPVTFAVTHLQAGGGVRNASVRAAQIDEILDTLAAAVHPVVLLGDFNLYADETMDLRTRATLDGAGFVDVAEAVGATGGTYPGLKDRFDRVFVKAGCVEPLSAQVLDGSGMSDHHPVRADVRVAR